MRLPNELRAAIDHWAAEKKISRSQAVRALIEQGLKKVAELN
jgi:metal-responsive CopG/Arc/MetJ family transcriptional regulator